MQWIEEIKVIGVLIAGIALLLNVLQLRKSNTLKRIEIISDILLKIHENKELSSIFYLIESEDFKFKLDDFHCSEIEKNLDRLLYLFDIAANQFYLNHITRDDLELIKYEYLVVYRDREIKKYFTYLDEWFAEKKVRTPPFSRYRKLAEKMHISEKVAEDSIKNSRKL